jgi:tetratricopeptide (TPR) repeat protein
MLWVPVMQSWRERRSIWLLVFAVIVPITLIGLGLMLYNVRRFDDPFEFGIHYQMTLRSQIHEQLFHVRDFWLHLRAYFLETARWSHRFPFVHRAGDGFGVLTCIPLAWLALAAPLAWRGRASPAASALRWFAIAVAVLFGMCALTLGLYCFVADRYEAEFVPALVLLAVIGMLSLEHALGRQPLWRRVVRWGYGLLLAFSVAFGVFASVEGCAEADNDLGMQLQGSGQVPEAIRHYEQALRLNPDFADAHINLGNALIQSGRIQEAIGHYEQALRIRPDFFKAHNDFGVALDRLGRLPEAISHWEQALRIKPDDADAHYNLGTAWARTGKIEEAIEHFEHALRIKPDYTEAHCNLGIALAQTGRTEEAIAHFEQALWIEPDNAEAHCNLGTALEKLGRTQEAIKHYQQALRLRPDLTAASNALARLQAGQ